MPRYASDIHAIESLGEIASRLPEALLMQYGCYNFLWHITLLLLATAQLHCKRRGILQCFLTLTTDVYVPTRQQQQQCNLVFCTN